MTETAALLERLSPVLARISTMNVRHPETAARLNAAMPIDGPEMQALKEVVVEGLASGWLTPREAGGVRFGRLAKATDASRGFSIDAVDMNGAGPGHLHPHGEFDLCFALEGAPTFDGHPPGWTIYAPGSWHVPTVAGGRMAILYFLPDGAIRFGPRL